jgi:asparagine synthase (glutamine-hydrolysing)
MADPKTDCEPDRLAPPLEPVRGALRRAVLEIVRPQLSVALLFSGGLDSSLLARMVPSDRELELVTIGRTGSHDLESARQAAPFFPFRWRSIPFDDLALENSWVAWGSTLVREPEPRRSVLVSLGLAFEQLAGRAVVLGQGADELFGGYAHFEGLTPTESLAQSDRDLRRLLDADWADTMALAARWKVVLHAPYLDRGVLEEIRELPPKVRFPTGVRKGALRAIARAEGLPSDLADRPKKAMQYGTGVSRFVRERARAE